MIKQRTLLGIVLLMSFAVQAATALLRQEN
jgi:hypothetical protein